MSDGTHLTGLRISGVEAEAYVRHVTSQPWFLAAFPRYTPVTVQAVRGRTSAYRLEEVIRLAASARETVHRAEWTLLHELAHAVTAIRQGGTDESVRTRGHGHAWRCHYVLLVRHMLGYRAARYLRQAIEDGSGVQPY